MRVRQITCDLEGSLECLVEYTQPEKPIFFFDAEEQRQSFDPVYKDNKFLYLGIDFLPCELAYDACNLALIQLATSVANSSTGSRTW